MVVSGLPQMLGQVVDVGGCLSPRNRPRTLYVLCFRWPQDSCFGCFTAFHALEGLWGGNGPEMASVAIWGFPWIFTVPPPPGSPGSRPRSSSSSRRSHGCPALARNAGVFSNRQERRRPGRPPAPGDRAVEGGGGKPAHQVRRSWSCRSCSRSRTFSASADWRAASADWRASASRWSSTSADWRAEASSRWLRRRSPVMGS